MDSRSRWRARSVLRHSHSLPEVVQNISSPPPPTSEKSAFSSRLVIYRSSQEVALHSVGLQPSLLPSGFLIPSRCLSCSLRIQNPPKIWIIETIKGVSFMTVLFFTDQILHFFFIFSRLKGCLFLRVGVLFICAAWIICCSLPPRTFCPRDKIGHMWKKLWSFAWNTHRCIYTHQIIMSESFKNRSDYCAVHT